MWRELNDDGMKVVLRTLLSIDDERLEEDLRTHCEKFAEMAVQLARAKAAYERKKLEFEVLVSELAREYRVSLLKVTEKAVEEAVHRDEKYQRAKAELIDAKQEVEILAALVEAMEHKKDMIISYLSWKKEKAKLSQIFENNGGVRWES
jgi:leucyl aminopeptidase (aminopeptidase T)